MDYSNFIWKKVLSNLKAEDMVCKNCEFNFDGICAGHGSTYDYGEKIINDNKTCEDWGISLEFFIKKSKLKTRGL